MKTDSIAIIENLLKQSKLDMLDLDERMNAISRAINECEQYVIKMTKTDFDEFQIFSPRSENNHYLQEIEQKKSERKRLQGDLQFLKSQKANLIYQIEQLEKVLKVEKTHKMEISLEERDKQRAARLLRDSSLSKIVYAVDQLQSESMLVVQDPVKVRSDLDVISSDIRNTVDDMNNVIFNLYPSAFGHISLKELFEKKLKALEYRKSLKVDQLIEDVSCETISTVIGIYHIMQECLQNIEKHANAKHVTFKGINQNGRYIIEITDDGVGFRANEVNFGEGLTMMRDRIALLDGEYRIESTMRLGTKVHVEIPV